MSPQSRNGFEHVTLCTRQRRRTFLGVQRKWLFAALVQHLVDRPQEFCRLSGVIAVNDRNTMTHDDMEQRSATNRRMNYTSRRLSFFQQQKRMRKIRPQLLDLSEQRLVKKMDWMKSAIVLCSIATLDKSQ